MSKMIRREDLQCLLNARLMPASGPCVPDAHPNGLQVTGRSEIRLIVTGVTASLNLIRQAVAIGADAILVHHGYFWSKSSRKIDGILKNRLKLLLAQDISLFAYHLPLDIHPEWGNNRQLANQMGWIVKGEIPLGNGFFCLHGELESPMTPTELALALEAGLGQAPFRCSGRQSRHKIRQLAWCTGAGQSFLEQVAEYGIDTFVTGEVSESTVHIAREANLHFFAAGHHATERYGVQSLGQWIAQTTGCRVEYFEDFNPI